MSRNPQAPPLRIAIIGAGAAGLYAAHTARTWSRAHGTPIELFHFEADCRVGGRVNSVRDAAFADYAVEMGAEEVHGELSLLARLATACPGASLVAREEDYDNLYFLDGCTRPERDALQDGDMKKLGRFTEWLWRYKGPEDMTVADAAAQRQITSRCTTFAEVELGTEFGTDNVTLSVLGVQEIGRMWKAGERNFVLKGASLLDVIVHSVGEETIRNVQLGHAVESVQFCTSTTSRRPEAVVRVRNVAAARAEPDHDVPLRDIVVDCVLCTVSLGVLQARAINFEPPLSEPVQAIIDAQGFDAGIKVTLKFSACFWPKNMGHVYGTSIIRIFWAAGIGKGCNEHLTGFVMGNNAAALSARGETGIIEAALEELTILFGSAPREMFVGALVKDWWVDPLHRGAYSYPKMGGGGKAAILQLAQPHFDGRLFFCGEACARRHPATVFGAMEAAEAAVRTVLSRADWN